MPSLQSPVEPAGADAGASIVVALASAFFDFVSATGVAFVAVDVVPDAFSGKERRIAYERLLLDLIDMDQTLFVRRDEVEAQWGWVDKIRELWGEERLTPKPYAAGSWGPSAAIALAERDGVTWHE